MIVIFGASSRLGGHLYKHFKYDGFNVLGTYNDNKKNRDFIQFNLENQNLNRVLKNINPAYAVVSFTANPRPGLTTTNLDQSYKINVLKTKELIDACFDKEIIPIYLSTDNVFDGVKGNYSETDETNALNFYGKIKCEIEDYLFKSGRPYVLMRMGKVFGVEDDDTLFIEYLIKLREARELYCSTDQIFTPTYAMDFYEFVRDVIQNKLLGIFHLGSTYPTTRFEVVQQIANYFNLDKGKIIPCKINKLGLKEKRPLKIDLNIRKYKEISGKSEKSIDYYLRRLKQF